MSMRIIVAFLFWASATPGWLKAGTIFVSGNLRTDATDTRCGSGCTLAAADDDATWAQWAAYNHSFSTAQTGRIQVVTYGYAGGASGTGAVVPAGGFAPYLSLFDSSGALIESSSSGICPPGAQTLLGNCFDVQLNALHQLAAGNYIVSITAWMNLSMAENLGAGVLADGFTGLGNLGTGESLDFAFDLIFTPNVEIEVGPQAIPEPSTAWMAAMGGLVAGAATALRRREKQYGGHE